ncbi:GNAT family N-acetyltransferase [Acinetobacter variabilis]|uniref:GNAT family N-acetyltransferase n=1 Tax=Acinetobacter variabilis TaxID=70346 RepID=UPI0021CED283|nr:GNAT family protein [Acinetobacter variabilis]MCU4311798.1 GNAT family N-acetyltransferase [Acinetobacter variabilis]
MGLDTKILNIMNGLCFILINVVKFIFIKKIDEIEFDKYTIRGCKRNELKKVADFLEKMNNNAISSPYRKVVYYLFSNKTIFIVLNKGQVSDTKVLGVNLYYINYKDFKNSTVHGGYIGVLPENQGVGIATNLRNAAKKHFFKAKFLGISSRISINNKASLKTAQKMGYVVEYKYYDSSLNEERYYMICKLGNLSDVK